MGPATQGRSVAMADDGDDDDDDDYDDEAWLA